MGWLPFAGAVLVAASGGNAVAQAEVAAAAPEATSETLTIQDERYRRMTVPVTINGQGPFDFMIDTGAQATVLSHALADQLQLTERNSATLVGMASRRTVETTHIEEISFGSQSHFGATAALVEGENIGGADGILGLDTLQGRRVLIDFANRHMEVAEADDRRAYRGYEIVVRARRMHGQLIIARATIDGVRTAVMVDTGAQGSIGNAALQRALARRRNPHMYETQMTDINGVEATGALHVARNLELGRANIANFFIAFTPSPTFAAMELEDEPALILGMSELRLFQRVAIDFDTRRVLFDLPEGSALPAPAEFERYGG